MSLKTWPTHLFPAQSIDDPDLQGRIITGGVSVSGQAQAVSTDGGGFWRWAFSNIVIHTVDQVLAWRALRLHLKNGAQNIIVPFCNYRFAPRPIVDGKPLKPWPQVPHDDDTLFDDGTGYGTPLMSAHLVGAAPLRATEVTIVLEVGSELRGGEFFSVIHATKGPRLYGIEDIRAVAGGVYTVGIMPPLREATPDGAVIDFDNPRCVMRQVPNSMPSTLELGRHGKPGVAFVESFT